MPISKWRSTIYAPHYFGLLIGHGPLDAAFTDALLDTALEGLSRL
jgi:hypothetical protein